MSRAYGENNNNRGYTTHKTSEKALPMASNKKNTQRKENQSKLSHLANSVSGFYREKDVIPDGLSTKMKESEVARKIPNFKDKRQAKKMDKDSGTEYPFSLEDGSGSESMKSFFEQSNNNFKMMMNTMQAKPHLHTSNKALKPGKPNLKLKGMESIYL